METPPNLCQSIYLAQIARCPTGELSAGPLDIDRITV